MGDYYKILGISRNASSEEIKRAFHNLAHKHHPDKGGDESKFKEINEAYQVLSDKEKRAQYDQFGTGTAGAGPSSGNWDFSWAWGGGSPETDFGDLGEMFEDLFGFGRETTRSKRKEVKKGKDIRVDIEISLEETLKNITKRINLRKQTVCSRCQGNGAEPATSINECFTCRGTGEVQQIKRTFLGSFTQWSICPECEGEGQRPERPCNVCRGEGRIKGEEEIEIFIPAGVDTNQIIKISGKGETGRKSGRPGDLYVRILVKEHPIFKREGDDLIVLKEISFSQAVLGDEIEMPTLEGNKILLKVPAGTESGRVLRISNKGIPRFSNYGRGNLYVELIVKTPKKITKTQKELLEKLKKEGL